MQFEMILAERKPVMVEKNENGLILVTKKKVVAKAPKGEKIEDADNVLLAIGDELLKALTAFDNGCEKFAGKLTESVNSETRRVQDELKRSFHDGTILIYLFGFLAFLHCSDSLLAAIFILQKAICVIGTYLIYCWGATKIRKLMIEKDAQREMLKIKIRECKLNQEKDDRSDDSSEDSSEDSEYEMSQDSEFEREVDEEDM